MESCKNCFAPIEDLRKETRCTTCSAPLHKDCAINDGGTFCDVCYTVKEESAEKKLDFVVPEVIRRSYIETYRTCPYKFYHEVIKDIASPPNIYAQLGIDLHEEFDKASQGITTKKEVQEAFEKIFENYPLSIFGDVSKEKMYQRGINSIDTFFEVIKDMPAPFRTEETLQFNIGDDLPLVQTTSDRINLVDGELEMCDWKTGRVMVGEKLSTDLQAPLYIYGVRENFKMPIRKFTFYYLDENKTRVFERINENEYVCEVNKRKYYINLLDAIREVQTMFSHIKKGEFGIPRDTKKMYFACKMCHLQPMGVCQGADIQSWRQYNK